MEISSVQSLSMSDSLQPHGLQHARLSCTSPAPGACLNSCSLSQWCHPTISSSVSPFSFCLQSFPASGSFPVSQFFTSGSQSIELQHSSFQWIFRVDFLSVQFSSVTQSCPTFCNPMNRSTPGLFAHHQLPEFTQTHAHWVGNAIQPYHPLLSPSPPTFNLSQHQGLFKWVSSSHQVARLLEFRL